MNTNDKIQFIEIPFECPACGGETAITQDGTSRVLVCENPSCNGKLLGKLVHYCSRNAMDIAGLSESTLEKFLEMGFINSEQASHIGFYISIYKLKSGFYDDMVSLAGFGKKSVDKLMDAIEKSKNTTLDKFIYSLSIPNIGRRASKTIANAFCGNFEDFYNACCLGGFDFTSLEGFGVTTAYMIEDYLHANFELIAELASYLSFSDFRDDNVSSVDFSGMSFVITGSLRHFKNRDELKERIENMGGKVSGSISAKTSYLINNDIASESAKNKKAKEIGIPIITEEYIIDMMKSNNLVGVNRQV